MMYYDSLVWHIKLPQTAHNNVNQSIILLGTLNHIISFFTPEPTRGCCALFHIQFSSKCFSAPKYKHYLLLLKSAEFNEQDTSFLEYKHKHMMKYGAPPDKVTVLCYVLG